MMASTVRKSLCWVLTTFDIAPDLLECSELDARMPTKRKSIAESVTEVATSLPEEELENIKPTYSRDEVANHCSPESCWVILNNKVYDVTRFLRMHPGGDDIVLEHAGRDATSVFADKGHSSDAYDMLADYLIGEVTQEDWLHEKCVT